MADDTKKKATDNAEAAAAAAALALPTEGYDMFLPRLLVLVLAVFVLLIDGSLLCTVRVSMLRYNYDMHTVYAMLTVYLWISLIGKVLIFSTQIISGTLPGHAWRPTSRVDAGHQELTRP